LIRTRLILWNSVVFALTLMVIGVVVYVATERSLYGAVDKDLASRASFLSTHWHAPGGPFDHGHGPDHHGGPHDDGPRDDGPQDGPPKDFQNTQRYDPIQAQRLEFSFRISRPAIFDNGPHHGGHPPDSPFDAGALQESFKGSTLFITDTLNGHRIRVISLPLREGSKISGAAQFASDLTAPDKTIGTLGNILLALLPLSLLITVGIGFWLVKRALQPVRTIAETAEGIGGSNLSDRLTVKGSDEFAVLSGTFNSMLDRLESAFEQQQSLLEAQRRFIGDASHELKTPLTTIKGRVSLALQKKQTPERYEEHLKSIGRASDSMNAIIQDLLLLAQYDEGKALLHKEIVPVVDLARRAVLESGAPEDRIELRIAGDLTLNADEALVSRALSNLLVNALRHSEGVVTISADPTQGKVLIQVNDRGEGIPPEHLDHIFDRFHRVDTARDRASGGTGLGLAIVKSIIEAHGGSIRMESALGVGSTVYILMPGN
jgi:signal transduction histidine kinase